MENPKLYLRFAGHRLRPGLDLLARVSAAFGPRIAEPQVRPILRAVDLGCGPGNLTVRLLPLYPKAKVLGVDMSGSMIERARQMHAGKASDRLTFLQKPLEDFSLNDMDGEAIDLIFSNAALHWVSDHHLLLPKLIDMLDQGGVLAFQIPDTRVQPSHVLMKEAVQEFGISLDEVRMPQCEHDATFYHDLLLPHCRTLDIWSTSYLQELVPGLGAVVEEGEAERLGAQHVAPPPLPLHPVAEFFSSTGLSPFLKHVGGLHSEQGQALLASYSNKLSKAYPLRPSGVAPSKQCALIEMKRLFVVARKKGQGLHR